MERRDIIWMLLPCFLGDSGSTSSEGDVESAGSRELSVDSPKVEEKLGLDAVGFLHYKMN